MHTGFTLSLGRPLCALQPGCGFAALRPAVGSNDPAVDADTQAAAVHRLQRHRYAPQTSPPSLPLFPWPSLNATGTLAARAAVVRWCFISLHTCVPDLDRDLTALDRISSEEDSQDMGEPLEFIITPHENPFKVPALAFTRACPSPSLMTFMCHWCGSRSSGRLTTARRRAPRGASSVRTCLCTPCSPSRASEKEREV